MGWDTAVDNPLQHTLTEMGADFPNTDGSGLTPIREQGWFFPVPILGSRLDQEPQLPLPSTHSSCFCFQEQGTGEGTRAGLAPASFRQHSGTIPAARQMLTQELSLMG